MLYFVLQNDSSNIATGEVELGFIESSLSTSVHQETGHRVKLEEPVTEYSGYPCLYCVILQRHLRILKTLVVLRSPLFKI